MGGFKFKPESVLDFYMPGWGAATTQAMAISQFQNYLSHAGISPDKDGYLDTDQFLTTYSCQSMVYPNIAQQYGSSFGDENGPLYQGYLYSSFENMPTVGYITLPFKVNGEQIKVVLPGTICLFYNCIADISMSASTKFKFSRTSDAINIYYASDNTLYKTIPATSFDKGVVPFYAVFLCQGGGGGGSSQEGLVAGRGGGGGGFAAGIINILENNSFYFTVGGCGFGGIHKGNDGATADRHDGESGSATYVSDRENNSDLILAEGGKGGVAQDTAPSKATGGKGQITSEVIPLRLSNGSNFAGSSGGTGLIDQGSTTTSVSAKQLFIPGASSLLSSTSYGSNTTYSSGTMGSLGGGAGGPSWFANGGNGGDGANVGSNGTKGSGGGGGGYLLGSYIIGGAGGNGSIKIYC